MESLGRERKGGNVYLDRNSRNGFVVRVFSEGVVAEELKLDFQEVITADLLLGFGFLHP